MDYNERGNMFQNIKSGGVTTEYATGAIVIGCVVALWLIRRGFRGVSIGSVGSVSIGS